MYVLYNKIYYLPFQLQYRQLPLKLLNPLPLLLLQQLQLQLQLQIQIQLVLLVVITSRGKLTTCWIIWMLVC